MKKTTSIIVDSKMLEIAKKKGINLSEEFREFLKFRLSLGSEIKIEDEIDETKQKLEDTIRIKANLENNLSLLQSQLDTKKKEQKLKKIMLEDPIIQKSIKIVRKDSKYFFGRLTLLKKKGYDIDEIKFKDMIESKRRK